MERLVLIRHGSYADEDERINDDGRKQMTLLAERLRELNGSSVLLLSSTAPRALDSAEVLSGLLEIPIEEHAILWSDIDHPMNFKKTLDLIRESGGRAQTLLVVTHLDYAKYFPGYFAQEEWAISIRSFDVWKGQAVILDCIQKTVQLLS